ncbi:Smg-4/UPF3 family-domain-containing protein, partial [Dissophora ornata]
MSTAGGPSKRAARSKGLTRGQARTKIVVRRLPANLPEPVFVESIKLLVPETSLERATTWVPGKVSKNPVKGNTFARAYIYFKNEKLALEFQKAYHGHVFMDRNGNEGRAHVEFALFQKIPRHQKKPDAKQGTIEEGDFFSWPGYSGRRLITGLLCPMTKEKKNSGFVVVRSLDPDYIAFIQSLNAEPTEADKEMKLSGTELLLKESAINPKSTPLLEALRAQKAAAQAKAAAAKLAARQGRQAGKAGLSNSSKQQITILSSRNAKDRAQSSSNAASASNKNQQNQQSVQQQGKKAPQTVATAAVSAEADANGQSVKAKRERRRRDRASKRAGAEGAATNGGGAAGVAPVPQITLLKPKPAHNPPASGGASQSTAHTPNVSKQAPQGSQGPPNSGGRRGQQNQGGQQQQQQQ